MYVRCFTAHLDGLHGRLIEVEVDISNGLPHFDIVGLPGSALKEAKERVRSAIKNSGFEFPHRRITVNLAPAHVRKDGSYYDLVIALGILIADKQISLDDEAQARIQNSLFISELALDGSTRSSHGILPLVLAAKENNMNHVFLPVYHHKEASIVKGVNVIPVNGLKQVVQLLNKEMSAAQAHTYTMTQQEDHIQLNPSLTSMEDIRGQEHVKRAFEVAACGQHHMLMVGPPGSGKTLLAKSFQQLLPALKETEALEVTRIYSVAGYLKDRQGLIRDRPFRAPHHTITLAGMVGGGVPINPGEISLAHQGVLFLDEFLEFKREVVEALREPLEEGEITLTRGNQHYAFPAQFLMILALNPCPCGYYGHEDMHHTCTCTAAQVERYQQKLSGPLFDRIDLHLEVPLVPIADIQDNEINNSGRIDASQNETKDMIKRIEQGLAFKRERTKNNKPNQALSVAEIKRECRLNTGAKELLNLAYQQLSFSARGYHKLLKISRTIADINGTESIDEKAISEAIHYRSLDRLQGKREVRLHK
ncbi:YifB family Mg chelatase-like AAA ATPase [Caldalkalibacillus salinus]|uniref:YifB family Mg chelatase-like AAA ATPase n=1 Tax=Caldalkalibacillus salinus TaxID=2803787 RepID=UPI001922E3CD|nr:YifB family Mg chelatase-like AAA ATPase [Caldalkalibacillus salinus]